MSQTCEFLIRSHYDKRTGVKHPKAMEQPCGDPAARYKCSGELANLKMPLCDFHANFVATKYKWTLTKENENNDQHVQAE